MSPPPHAIAAKAVVVVAAAAVLAVGGVVVAGSRRSRSRVLRGVPRRCVRLLHAPRRRPHSALIADVRWPPSSLFFLMNDWRLPRSPPGEGGHCAKMRRSHLPSFK
ncbi:unnamed protein product [Prorocentrum cordatum]|uniref:Uncharacterized protein n=1 Tax=Prorocentrum cordatum TaxID=2364126 RepID=A0ABN9YB45_9DINO|nr:unnamed protein product [Polarella glacialis]